MSETHTLSERYGLREITPASLVAQAKRILGPERDPIMKPGDSYALPRDEPPSWTMVNELCRDVIDLLGRSEPEPKTPAQQAEEAWRRYVEPWLKPGQMSPKELYDSHAADQAKRGPSHPLKTGVGE